MAIPLTELVFDSSYGHDVLIDFAHLDFNPKDHKTCESAAKALHAELCKAASAIGQNPAIELSIRAPGEDTHIGKLDCWLVAWEAGPFDWAVRASFSVSGPWGYTEPYHGFDLCFVEN